MVFKSFLDCNQVTFRTRGSLFLSISCITLVSLVTFVNSKTAFVHFNSTSGQRRQIALIIPAALNGNCEMTISLVPLRPTKSKPLIKAVCALVWCLLLVTAGGHHLQGTKRDYERDYDCDF